MMRMRVLLTSLTLISSLTSFAAYTLLLRYLGTSADVDRLFYASSAPLSLAGVATGVLLYLLPPRLTHLSPRVQDSTARVLAALVLLVVSLAVAAAGAYALLFEFSPFWLLWIGFCVTAGLLVLSTLTVCLAQTRGIYLQTGVAPMIMSSGLLLGVLAAVASGIEWLMLPGQLLGAAVALFWLSHALGVGRGSSVRRDLLHAIAALSPLRPHALAILLGTTAFTLFQPIDALLCTQLSNGAVTVMSYSQRVLVAVSTAVSLGAHAIAARTSHDTFRAGGHGALVRMANMEVLRVVSFGLFTWLVYVAGGNRLLQALLSSSTMTHDDLDRLIRCLDWMLLGVGPMAAMPYLFRVFYSLQAYTRPAVIGMFVPPVYGALAWALLGRHDILGLAYSYCAVWWLALAAAMLWFNRGPAPTSTPRPHLP